MDNSEVNLSNESLAPNEQAPVQQTNTFSAPEPTPPLKNPTPKNQKRILIISIIIASVVLVGGLTLGIVLCLFSNSQTESPSPIEETSNSQPAQEEQGKVYASDLTGFVKEQKDNGKNIEEIIKLLDQKIEEIEDSIEKKSSKTEKIYALIQNDYFDSAKSELEKLGEKEPEMAETCAFNKYGLVLAEHFNDETSKNRYTEKINVVCSKGRG